MSLSSGGEGAREHGIAGGTSGTARGVLGLLGASSQAGRQQSLWGWECHPWD